MKRCDLDEQAVCRQCNRQASHPRARRICDAIGLGTHLATALDAVGVTKQRAAAAAAAVGLGSCGCEERERWMNEVSAAYLGIGRPAESGLTVAPDGQQPNP